MNIIHPRSGLSTLLRALRLMLLVTSLISEVQLATALHRVYLISPEEYLQRKLIQDKFTLFRFPPSMLRPLQTRLSRLADPERYPQVMGLCPPRGRLDAGGSWQNRNPLHPLFPYPEEYLNKMLRRPEPDTVAENIRLVTDGKLSTVREVVDLVNGHLLNGSLNQVSDDLLTLLATNFHTPQAGFMVGFKCPWVIGGLAQDIPAGHKSDPRAKRDIYPEDLLVSQDEQRALVAGFLYVVSDDGYFARRHEELERVMGPRVTGSDGSGGGNTGSVSDSSEEDREEKDHGPTAAICPNPGHDSSLNRGEENALGNQDQQETGKCEAQLTTATDFFIDQVLELFDAHGHSEEYPDQHNQIKEKGNQDVQVETTTRHRELSESELIGRYSLLVQQLRAELYAMIPRVPPTSPPDDSDPAAAENTKTQIKKWKEWYSENKKRAEEVIWASEDYVSRLLTKEVMGRVISVSEAEKEGGSWGSGSGPEKGEGAEPETETENGIEQVQRGEGEGGRNSCPEDGFIRFFEEQRGDIEMFYEKHDLTEGVLKSIVWGRWKRLTRDERRGYT